MENEIDEYGESLIQDEEALKAAESMYRMMNMVDKKAHSLQQHDRSSFALELSLTMLKVNDMLKETISEVIKKYNKIELYKKINRINIFKN